MFVSHLARLDDQHNRDLASVELWERSIERSRRRRELAAVERRHAPRRKGVSLAMSAALLASPMVPLASAHQARSTDGAPAQPEPKDTKNPTLLGYGDTGAAVAAVQRQVNVDDDGIYGPITREAVADFQTRAGLQRTGEVDAQTWAALFRASVSVVPSGSAAAKAVEASGAAVSAPAEAPAGDAGKPKAPRERTSKAPQRDAGGERDDDGAELEREARGGGKPTKGVDLESEAPAPAPKTKPVVLSQPTGDAACGGELETPVKGIKTGDFGEDRGSHRHAGLDIAAPTGTAVRAAQCGLVTDAGSQGAYGNIVCIQHTSSVSTCYAHLSGFNTQKGAYVEVGQLIGRVGSTGRSTGPHLHFEVRENGKAQDPEPYLSGERRLGGTPTGTGGGGDAKARAASTGGSQGSASTSGSSGTAEGGASAAPSSQPAAQPAPAPAPAAQPASQPAPAPQAQPAAQTQPAPAPAPQPEPQAQPAPEPQPAAQQAAPAPQPAPVEQTASAPAPQPAPAPAGAPEPVVSAAAPAPAPAPEPAAAAEPAPAPVQETPAAPAEPAPEQAAAPVEEPAAVAEQVAEQVEEAVAPATEAAEQAAASAGG